MPDICVMVRDSDRVGLERVVSIDIVSGIRMLIALTVDPIVLEPSVLESEPKTMVTVIAINQSFNVIRYNPGPGPGA